LTKFAIPFNARVVEAFAGVFLSPMYDNPAPTPAFHREGWELYCSDAPLAGIAAPRGHAKSTAFTHDFGLAAALFRHESHILIVSATEELSMSHLTDIAKELRENEDIRVEFGISKFLVDSKGEIVVKCNDGYEFRFLARGAGQKLRGLKWNGRRPGLIICDDMEEDEQVASLDRRQKFSRWVLRALLPIGRRGAKIRWHGTILHVDSFLAHIMKSLSWKTLFYKAHAGFDDFENILWPEAFNQTELRRVRQVFVDRQDAAGYSQEYLNDPLDNSEAYLQRAWFIAMNDSHREAHKTIAAAADFAISKKDRANRTSFTVGGMTTENLLCFLDQRVGRWDSLEIVDEIWAVWEQWKPDVFFVEHGQIWLALWPQIQKRMLREGRYINFVERKSITDKASRGRSLQARMRASATRWEHEAHWFEGMQDEMLRFTGHSDATLDDQFDSAALLSLGFDDMPDSEEDDFDTEEEIAFQRADPRLSSGRNSTTGY
jgi:predicted phage terminase large subunit-like protein